MPIIQRIIHDAAPRGSATCARTVEIAQYLIDRGADLNARDVDHESTPAQYLVRDAPQVVRLLVERGAWFDIFIAVGLRDAALVERCLREDPEARDHRTWQGRYTVAHNGKRAATGEEIGDRRGDVYRWVFDHNISAVEAAMSLGYEDIVEPLLRHASPAHRLLAACFCRTIRRSGFPIQPTRARRWASACTGRCTGGNGTRATSRPRSGYSSPRGERPDPADLPTGRDDVDAVLRTHLGTSRDRV
jgi:hypothetical protein